MKKGILIIVGVMLVTGLVATVPRYRAGNQQSVVPEVSASLSPTVGVFVEPIAGTVGRITKKPFGLYVSPADSPVSPEKFTGYHTGVDFETLPGEQGIDVPIYAICAGPLQQKRTATGYGGVAVQACTLAGQPITVIYGHIKLTSITATVGQQLAVGQKLGILGEGFSSETGGERKHLHLGIHRGSAINILGYVQTTAELSAWVNVAGSLR